MFQFRIITIDDGVDIIDRDLQTPYDSLTPSEFIEYIELDKQIAYMDRMEAKRHKAAVRQRKLARNPLRKIACFCGIM